MTLKRWSENKTMTSWGLLVIKHEQWTITLKVEVEKNNDWKRAVGYQAWTKGNNSEMMKWGKKQWLQMGCWLSSMNKG